MDDRAPPSAAGSSPTPVRRSVPLVLARGLVRAALVLPLALATAALAAATFPGHGVLAALVGVSGAAALVLLRSLRRTVAVVAVAVGAVGLWFALLAPSNDRDWQPDVTRPARVSFDGDLVTVRDVRDFAWTGADTGAPRFRDRTFDLRRLDSAWLTLSYWDGNTAICHTMLSFGFDDGQVLAVSVETRKEVGEEYSAWKGFFKRFELFYVLAEERDVIGVRATHRGEDLYQYPLRTPPDRRRALLEDILRTAAALADTPEWYGALARNCTTTLQHHIDHALGRAPRFRWDTVLNGDIDRKAWDRGGIDDDRPFETVRASHRITDAARAAAGADDFSARIRAPR